MDGELDTDEIDRMYEAALDNGPEPSHLTPSYMVCHEGAFLHNADGSVTVFAFDAEGNHYDLPAEEQERRKEALRKRLGL
jgi:hypothetical protein